MTPLMCKELEDEVMHGERRGVRIFSFDSVTVIGRRSRAKL